MKALNFAKRNIKELLRDPISIIFCLALPLFLLIIFQQFKIPSTEYKIEYFTPSIVIFSYGFITLFTATLIAKDRSTSFLTRLFASPMKSIDYILGYTLALLPIAAIQSVLFFVVALFFGLKFSINIIFTILILMVISLLFIALGILIGCISNEKQASTIGSLGVQLVSFTSGMWFPINTVGNVYRIICRALPFSHTLDLTRSILLGTNENVLTSLTIIIIYIAVIYGAAIKIFNGKMNSDNK